MCRLRHEELLDAAHILPDMHPLGQPIVPNWLALRKLHHAAFDVNIVGARPDLVIEIRQDVLGRPTVPCSSTARRVCTAAVSFCLGPLLIGRTLSSWRSAMRSSARRDRHLARGNPRNPERPAARSGISGCAKGCTRVN